MPECSAKKIKEKRKNMGLTQAEFADLLGMKQNGERTVRGWELGEHEPSRTKWKLIDSLPDRAPFKRDERDTAEFTFIDLFAGIGGIRLPFQELGGQCVFSSEWDKFSRKTYAANYGELPAGDITKIAADSIPDHDVLLAGFPCQAFSQAGLKQGFNDTRGTLFFEIQRIMVAKKPKMFLLENVKQLKGHDKGRTLKTILDILQGSHQEELPADLLLSAETRKALETKLNYHVEYRVLRAGDFGIPQNRERIYIAGFDKDYFGDLNFEALFQWPVPPEIPTKVGDILEPDSDIDDSYTISEKLWDGHQRRKREHIKKGNGFGYSLFTPEDPYTSTLSARYYKDGSEILIDQSHLGKRPRKLTPRECARLQGFPDKFVVDAVSGTQAYRQFGNSVAMPVIRAIASHLITVLTEFKKNKIASAA